MGIGNYIRGIGSTLLGLTLGGLLLGYVESKNPVLECPACPEHVETLYPSCVLLNDISPVILERLSEDWKNGSLFEEGSWFARVGDKYCGNNDGKLSESELKRLLIWVGKTLNEIEYNR